MSRSRNNQQSQKDADDVAEILRRQNLLMRVGRADLKDVDLKPIKVNGTGRTIQRIFILDQGRRIQIVRLQETAHVRMVS